MNRRKKKLARHLDGGLNPPGTRYPAKVRVISDEKSTHEYICEGCDRISEDIECRVYAQVPPYYIRQGCCPFNRKDRAVPRANKVRVGQQKTKSQRIR